MEPANGNLHLHVRVRHGAAKEGGFKVVGVGNENIRFLADDYLNSMKEFNLSEYESAI